MAVGNGPACRYRLWRIRGLRRFGTVMGLAKDLMLTVHLCNGKYLLTCFDDEFGSWICPGRVRRKKSRSFGFPGYCDVWGSPGRWRPMGSSCGRVRDGPLRGGCRWCSTTPFRSWHLSVHHVRVMWKHCPDGGQLVEPIFLVTGYEWCVLCGGCDGGGGDGSCLPGGGSRLRSCSN
jgi:hypothetical protein